MKNFIYLPLAVLFFLIPESSMAQLDSVWYQGPSGASVTGGATQTTDNFSFFHSPGEPTVIPPITIEEPVFEPLDVEWDESQLPPYVYIEDPNTGNVSRGGNGQTVLLNKFPGIPMTNFIPPDPTMAVGPNHVVVCVNSEFSIYDKNGTELKNINAGSWFLPISPYENGDPQILYDHYDNRWVMLYMGLDDATQFASNLIGYSDDDNPLGTWYIYSLNTKNHGSVPSNTWGDYPQLGYDEEAIYIMTRCFAFGGSYNYNKIRIIDKSEFYNSNGGPLSWVDFWNIRTPGQGATGQALDVIHPSISYTPGEGGYFFYASRTGGNFYALYRVINPLSSNPTIRGKVIPVQTYGFTPNANQLGGGALRIEANGSHCKTAPVVRDGKLYMAHSIANSTNGAYASAKYVVFEFASNTIIEQAELGAIGYFYIYPTITVDKDHNIAVTFSRSADTEYIGGYYSTKYAGDPPGLNPSQPLAVGLGNYVVDYGSGRNRWGDYLGIYLDPSNEYDVWIFPEYAAATNTWGTYIGRIRMVPFAGIYTYLSSSVLNFGDVEVNTISDTLNLIVSNYGTDDLIISDIATGVGPFIRTSNHTFPDTLHTYDSVTVKIIFAPTQAGDYDELLSVTSNDPNFTGIQLIGHGYDMIEPYTDIFYASTGSGSNGDILLVDRGTGAGTVLGNSLFTEITSLAVNQNTNVLFGLVSGSNSSKIVRVNAGAGDAYTLFELDIPLLSGIDFDNTDTLYASHQNGEIFKIDINNGSYTSVVTAAIQINAIAFHPTTNQLWAAIRKTFGAGKDSIYTIDLSTGAATPIGVTGFAVMTQGLAFDEDNKLYGVTGTSNQEGKIFEIDQTNGTGTVIGTGIGFNHTLGLAFSINGPILSADDTKLSIPEVYSLIQNYPNPFNPATTIEFSLPVASDVKLTIYNILGQEVATLLNEQRNAGFHSVVWNSTNSQGASLSSGIYFYKIDATGNDGSKFHEVRKMVLMK